MARIRSFVRSTSKVAPHPTEVDCEYTTVGTGQTRLLHLATLGSDQRKRPGIPSQLIQLDEERARELLRIVRETFPGI